MSPVRRLRHAVTPGLRLRELHEDMPTVQGAEMTGVEDNSINFDSTLYDDTINI